jgi:cytosine/adenosine deaminase-related metal-dependent hydrolase
MTQRLVIQNGTVITGDKELGTFPRADILVEGSLIRAVQPDMEVSESTVIDASGMMVMPGLVDAHRHTWEGTLKQLAANSDLGDYASRILAKFGPVYRPEDAYIGTLIGALEALDAGITTLFDWSHIQNTPEHTDAVLRGLQESGMRAIFGYGVPHTGQEWSYESPLNHPEDARRVRTQYFSSDQQRVTMAMALRGPEFSTMDVTRHDWKLARDLGLPISVHVGSGPFGVPYRAIERLSQDHLLGPDTQYVHTTTLTDEAIQLLAESGGTAVVTPAVEMQMGFGLPATHRLMAHGIRPGLGVDIVTSTAGDLFTQMRAAFQVARLQALQEGSSSPTVEDIFALATIDGARASWLDQKIGTLTPGKQADIILLTTNTLNLTPLNDPVASVVLGAHAGNVDTVLVAGKTLKQGGRLLHIDLEQIRAQATASRDYLMEASGFSKTV